MKRRLLLLALLALTLVVGFASAYGAHSECRAVLYGRHTCPHCRATWEALTRLGVNATFLDVETSSAAAQAYAEMFKRYMAELSKYYGVAPGVPLTFIECGGHQALVLGELLYPGYARDQEYILWSWLAGNLSRGVAVNAFNRTVRFVSVTCISLPECTRVLPRVAKLAEEKNLTSIAERTVCLADLALCLAYNTSIQPVIPGAKPPARPKPVEARQPLTTLIPVLVGLALLDAINPCFLALYTLTVATVASTRGRRAALLTGLGVALGVFTGYYLLGLGLLSLLSLAPWLREALAIAVIALGAFTLAKEAGIVRLEGEQCLVCRLAARLGIGSAQMTPLLGYAFGFIASLTLLPCSAGPYAIAAIYLAGYPLLLRLLGLLVYNLVFIAPILAMAAAAGAIAAYARAERIMRLVAGPLLIILGLLIIAGYA